MVLPASPTQCAVLGLVVFIGSPSVVNVGKGVWAIKKGGPVGVALATSAYVRLVSAHTSHSEDRECETAAGNGRRLGSAPLTAHKRGGCHIQICVVAGAGHKSEPLTG